MDEKVPLDNVTTGSPQDFLITVHKDPGRIYPLTEQNDPRQFSFERWKENTSRTNAATELFQHTYVQVKEMMRQIEVFIEQFNGFSDLPTAGEFSPDANQEQTLVKNQGESANPEKVVQEYSTKTQSGPDYNAVRVTSGQDEQKRQKKQLVLKDRLPEDLPLQRPVLRCNTQQEGGQHLANPCKEEKESEREAGNSKGTSGDSAKLDISMKEMITTMKLAWMPCPTFKGGTCGDYWQFKNAFQNYVDIVDLSDKMKIKMLLLAYTGPVKLTLQEKLQAVDSKTGYKQAFDLLEETHGNELKYVQELFQKVRCGPSVSLTGIQSLRNLNYDLINCVSVAQSLGYLNKVDTDDALPTIAGRFKGKLRECYEMSVFEYINSHNGSFPGMEWLQSFLLKMLRKAHVSAMQRHETMSGSQRRTVAFSSPQPRKEISLAISPNESGRDTNMCPLCKGTHSLDKCQDFHGMSVRTRSTYIREENRCYACFRQGHRMSECWQHKLCGVGGCTHRHSHLLHFTSAWSSHNSKPSSEEAVASMGRGPQRMKRFSGWRSRPQSRKRQRDEC